LLLLGDAQSLSWLADQIDSRQQLDFADSPNVMNKTDVHLYVRPTEQTGRLTQQANVFDWEISAIEAPKFAQQLRELAASASPAHTYLDPESNVAGIEVIASMGEYDGSKVFVSRDK
jgi:hypothetical protein